MQFLKKTIHDQNSKILKLKDEIVNKTNYFSQIIDEIQIKFLEEKKDFEQKISEKNLILEENKKNFKVIIFFELKTA